MQFPSLKYGQNNKAVLAMQNALHRYLSDKGIKHENKRNGVYGELTRRDVARLKRHSGIEPVNGRVFGSGAWGKLNVKHYIGEYDKSLIRQHIAAVNRARAAAKAKALELEAKRQPRIRLKTVALKFYAERRFYTYRQYRPMPPSLFSILARNRLDCSSSTTLIFKEAEQPDPNGRGYDGHGYTGTLWVKGKSTFKPEAGDLAFYGYQAPNNIPSHVAIFVSPTHVVSFGSTPVKYLPVNYRSDYRGARSYV